MSSLADAPKDQPPASPPCRVVPLQGDARIFLLMTFTPYRPLLENIAEPVRAFAAYVGDEPCGLVLGDTDASGFARLLSLFVVSSRRRQGIARSLVQAFCHSYPERPVWTRWSNELPQLAAFEALLASTGWLEKQIDILQVTTTPRRIIDYANSRPRWRMVDRIGGYTWTPWAERSAEDTEAVRAILSEEDVPENLDPLNYEQEFPVWTENSMLLRLNGTPVGWILTQRLDDAVLYDCNYVRTSIGRIGAVIPMMVAMFRRQGELLGMDSPCRYFVSWRTPAMIAISRGSFRGAHAFVEHFASMREPGR